MLSRPARPEREGHHQHQPVADPVEGDRAEQQHQGRGAGDDPGRRAHRQQAAHREVLGRRVGVPARAVVVVVVVVVTVPVVVAMACE